MGSVKLITCFILFFCAIFVKADECVKYNFETGVESLFSSNNGESLCIGMTDWSVGSYSDFEISSPDSRSSSFLYTSSQISRCGSSFGFSMTTGGVVEVNVYLDDNLVNQITVMVMSGNTVVGMSLVSPSSADFTAGWQTVKVEISVGIGTFDGYITIFGAASEDSLVLIDSFRYIPPGLDEDECVIYSDIIDSTTETDRADATTQVYENVETTTQGNDNENTTTETTEEILYTTTPRTDDIDVTTEQIDGITATTGIDDIATTTPGSNEGVEECTTYNFESDFDVLFSTDNYLCDGFLPWQLDNYTSIGIASPDSQSTLFISPHEVTSCMASFVFKMEPDGIVEANVYMDPVEALDHIIILAHRITDREYDTTAGFKMYHPGNQVFVTGWNVIRFSLLELTSFDGYLILIGSAESSSTVLVDSIRYIPPLTSPEDASCNIY